jgi:hypothetical protein
MARVERRRKWTAQEKAALLAEVEAEGGKVAIVARRHRISESVLYNWRAAWKAAAAVVMQAPVAATSRAGRGLWSGPARSTRISDRSQRCQWCPRAGGGDRPLTVLKSLNVAEVSRSRKARCRPPSGHARAKSL